LAEGQCIIVIIGIKYDHIASWYPVFIDRMERENLLCPALLYWALSYAVICPTVRLSVVCRHISTSGFATMATETAVFALFLPV